MAESASFGSTSTSLIRRAKDQEPQAWERLSTLFGPFVYSWARRAGLQGDDAADIVQEVFVAVAGNITNFRHDRPGDSFRAWLRTICNRKLIDFFRKRQTQPTALGESTIHVDLARGGDPLPPPQGQEDDDEVCRLRRRTLALLEDGFREDVWQAFWRTAVEGDPPRDVAEDLHVSVWFVYKAKSRVLQRLRTELEDL